MTCNSHTNQEFDEQTQRINLFLDQVDKKLVVMSGKGGVGKSTVAANLAVALSNQGYQVGLLDIDVHGPSIAGLLGLTEQPLLTDGEQLLPIEYSPTLKVVTVQGILEHRDDPVICRGPFKIGMIRQFLGDVNWGPLDFLIIDSPPGTGDEPLTIAQTVAGCQAVIVTTPQEIALADVRKSIQFCRKVELPIAGIIENMSGFVCPSCGSRHDIFKSGGGEKTAAAAGLPFLGRLPLDPSIVAAGDTGEAISSSQSHTQTDLQHIVAQLLYQLNKRPAINGEVFKIAVPVTNGTLSDHFGHCKTFSIFSVREQQVVQHESLTPPPHAPGVIPDWLAEQGCRTVITGGLGEGAKLKLGKLGIETVCGAPSDTPENLIIRYLQGDLVTRPTTCNHDHAATAGHNCQHT